MGEFERLKIMTVQQQHDTTNLPIKAYHWEISTTPVQILNMDVGSPMGPWPCTQHRTPGPKPCQEYLQGEG